MIRVFSLLVSMFTATAVFSQSISEGLRMMEVDKMDAAKKVFYSLYKKTPNAEHAYYLGNVYYEQSKPDSALMYFNEGVKLNPEFPSNYVGLGKIAYPKNQAEGKKNFDKALELTKSKNAAVLASIAGFYIDYDKLEVPQANSLLNTALKYDAKNPNHYILLGDGFWKIQDGTKAVENYDKALALNPKNPKALTRLGDSYIKVMNYNRSLDYYSKALAADSLYAPAYKGMGDAYYKNKQYDKAQTAYKKYVAIADQNDDTYTKYSSFLIMSKDYSNALTYLQKMENKENINPVAYRLLGMAYFEKGDMGKSQNNYDKLFAKLDSKKLLAVDYEYYGKLMAKSKKDSLAVLNLEKSLQMDSSRVDLYSDLGNAYFGLNKYDKAQKAFERKVKAGAGTQDLYFLGLSYYYDNKFEKADTTFGTLLKYVPTYAQGVLWKAKIKANLDPTSEKGLAKPYYEKFIEMTKNDVEKNKKDIIKAYEYLGYYYYLNKDKVKGKEVYTKLKEIDPDSKSAAEGLKWINGK